MTTAPAQISIEDYLHTVYNPDCDFVDGELEEREVGEFDHATWQGILIRFFGARAQVGNSGAPAVAASHCSRLRPHTDVCLLNSSAPIEQFATRPPLAVFEVLSPEDRMIRVMDRLADFDQMGVPAIWVIDPRKSTYSLYSSGHLTLASAFELPGTDHRVEMPEIASYEV